MLDYANLLEQIFMLTDAEYGIIIEDDLLPAMYFDAHVRNSLASYDSELPPWSYITLYSVRFYAEPQPIYKLIKHKKGTLEHHYYTWYANRVAFSDVWSYWWCI